MSDDQIQNVRSRIAQMHDDLEKVLFSTSLAIENDLTPERMVAVKNTVAELEKNVMNLGSTVTKQDRPKDYELPLQGVLPDKGAERKTAAQLQAEAGLR